MSQVPSLSIVIPHLNEPHDLERCLRALDDQRTTAPPFEIIVVDNGSTDLPVAVCGQFPDLRLEVETVPGPGPARNLGARLARSQLLAFIDADCVAAPGWVSEIVSFFDRRQDIDFIGGDIRILRMRKSALSPIEAYETMYSYRNQLYVEKHGFSATGNMAVRSDVFRAVGPFGGLATMEDTDWGKKATGIGYRSAFVGAAAVYTPSCRSASELRRRWDRHIAHEFRSVPPGLAARFRWIGLSVAVAASPVAEVSRIVGTNRLSGGWIRLSVFSLLVRMRLYRASRMLALAWHDTSAETVGSWNRL
jgi:cellulose synthase/poly-beta-1,6-N-acetylglucosamine synthase-like glycosyltransferase